MKKGIIFNIQKFCLHDGPGIRTTVFLKGCPLRCKWCSNPESQLEKIQVLYDFKKCIHCHTCIHTCPQESIFKNENQIQIHSETCTGCLQCISSCPARALETKGEYKEVEEIVSTCLQDRMFYEESSGGVTISGGEGMEQPEFLHALVKRLKEEGIHVAIETTGYIKPKTFQQLAPLFDLLLFDVKHYDSQQHLEGTGVPNKLIKKNLSWAIQEGIPVLPRIPVIPEFNASLKDAEGLCQFLLEVDANRVQLLPFHQFGEKKYELLHQEYNFKNKKALYPEDLKNYQQVFLENGIDCFF